MARESQQRDYRAERSQWIGWLWDACIGWYDDNAMRMSSSIAYYTLLSLAPILLLIVSIAGLFLGNETARGHIASAVAERFGEMAGEAIDAIISSAGDTEESTLGAMLSLAALFLGASGVFSELQVAMNTIWKVRPQPGRGLRGVLRDRVVCFAMVGTVALLVLVLLLMGAALALLGSRVANLPGGSLVWEIVDFGLSLLAVTLLLTLSYKTVPDVQIPLREVWPGALLTAGLFMLGEIGLGVYLRLSSVPKPQGAAGSLIVVVMWVYYSVQILFFGAEFTKARTTSRGIHIAPRRHAVRVARPGAALA